MGAMVIEDIVNAKWWIVLALVIVMLVCLIYITLMRWIAGPVVWFTLLAIVALLSYCEYLLPRLRGMVHASQRRPKRSINLIKYFYKLHIHITRIKAICRFTLKTLQHSILKEMIN